MTNTVSRTVSDETLNSIIQIESGGNLYAKAPTSSALGLGQFLNATWLLTVHKHRPDLTRGRTDKEVLELRTDPVLAVELLARFTEDNQAALGGDPTGGDLYLAHFLGIGDARKVFRSNPDTPVSQLVSESVITANKSIMRGKTAGQVRAWAAKRMHESGGHQWVAKYYKRPESRIEKPEPPQNDNEEPTAEDIPDTQDAPSTPLPPERDPVPPVDPAPKPDPVTPKAHEGFIDWIKRRAKTVSGLLSGGGVSIAGFSYFTDWKIVATLVGGIIVAGTVLGIFYLLSRKKGE